MIVLEVSRNDEPAVRAGIEGDGATVMMVHVTRRPEGAGRVAESQLTVGAFVVLANVDLHRLHVSLAAGDEIRLLVLEAERPTPLIPSPVATPGRSPSATGFEVARNGHVLARRRVAEGGSEVAAVSWSRESGSSPGAPENHHLNIGTGLTSIEVPLSVGDEVEIRMLGDESGSSATPRRP